jgi:nicotinamide mononucleotide adenylyltransferase
MVNMSGGLNDGVAIAAGRLNPPTRGHTVMVRELKRTAAELGLRPILYIVDGEKSGKDKSKNPLTANQRLEIARKLFPGVTIDIVSSAYEVLDVLYVQGYKAKAWVAGSDRASNYRKLVASEKLDCEIVEVDREAGDADGVSATAARQAAIEDNMEEFSHHMPDTLNDTDLADIADMIREAVNGTECKKLKRSTT